MALNLYRYIAAATSAVASLAADEAAFAQEEAQVAAEAAAETAAAAEARGGDVDKAAVAEVKEKEAKAAAAKERAAAAAETSQEAAAALATFEFPEFDLPDVDKRAAGAAVIGGLGLAVGVAEADLATSLMQVGGEAMMTTVFAFVFANNLVFKKDRDRFASSFDSRERFEDFWLSGAWTGKDSVASQVTRDAWEVFDPLDINGRAPTPDEKKSDSNSNSDSESASDSTTKGDGGGGGDVDVGGDDASDDAVSTPKRSTWDSATAMVRLSKSKNKSS
jgi:hypothetical protein